MAIISLGLDGSSAAPGAGKDAPGVIVTDGDERAALAVTRSLGRQGIPVYVGAEQAASLAGASKYCRRSFVYPSPWASPQEFTDSVMEHAHHFGVSSILPVTDLAVELLGKQPNADVIPPMDQYHALSDKYRLTRWAQEAGIPIPATQYVPNGDISRALDAIDEWPVVVKPGRSLYERQGVWKKAGVRYAHSAEELRRLYDEVEELQHPSLIQSRVIGRGEGIFGLFVQGKARALFAHRRLREKPPSGGVSVLRESIPVSRHMADYAGKIAESVGWHGIMMIEFKVDARSDTPYLMEVNGRFWGSLQLAIDAGVDFPWLLYRLAVRGEAPELQEYQAGITSRWWLGDLDHLLLRLRNTDRALDLPPGSPSKGETLRRFLGKGGRTVKNEVMRVSDVRPGFQELVVYGYRVLCRVGQGARSFVGESRSAVSQAVWNVIVRAGLQRLLLKTRLPSRISHVLVLCKGNICRSPFAACVLGNESRALQVQLDICSAGLETTPGKEAYPMAKQVCRQYGIDLDQHRTVSVTAELVEKADVVLVMEPAHTRDLLHRFPHARSKTFLLGRFSAVPVMEIEDPYGGNAQEFTRCYGIIEDACKGFLRHVRQMSPATSPGVLTGLQ